MRLLSYAHRRVHDLPGHGRGLRARRACSGKARERGLLDVRVHDLRVGDHRPAPLGRRRAVRRRRRHGADARAAVRRRRGGRPAAAAAATWPGRAALRPGHGPRAGGARRVLAAVRPLRRCRRAGARAPRRRRAVDRRLRAGRGRGGGDGGARGGRPAGARRHGQRGVGRATSPSPTGCSSTRSTPGRRSSGAGRCPRCCARATTAASPAGGGPRRSPARSRTGPDLIEPGAGSPPTRPPLLEDESRHRLRWRRPLETLASSEQSRAMNPTDLVDRAASATTSPTFAPGDTLKVHVRVVEGNKERVQVFQGVVIRRQGSGVRETFTVRKVSFGVGVERTFPVHSPIWPASRSSRGATCAGPSCTTCAIASGRPPRSKRSARASSVRADRRSGPAGRDPVAPAACPSWRLAGPSRDAGSPLPSLVALRRSSRSSPRRSSSRPGRWSRSCWSATGWWCRGRLPAARSAPGRHHRVRRPAGARADRRHAARCASCASCSRASACASPPRPSLIKRVVGLPGETRRGPRRRVYVDGRLLVEPYLPAGVVTTDFGPCRARRTTSCVMGDNRGDSQRQPGVRAPSPATRSSAGRSCGSGRPVGGRSCDPVAAARLQ